MKKEDRVISPIPGVWQCVDCGATSNSRTDFKHHKSCIPGCLTRWENYYERFAEEEHESKQS